MNQRLQGYGGTRLGAGLIPARDEQLLCDASATCARGGMHPATTHPAVRIFALLFAPLILTSASVFATTTLEVRGFVDAGVVVTDRYRSWLDGGIGKGRYGAGSDVQRELKPVLTEAQVIGNLSFGRAWRVLINAKYDDQQRHLIDVAEAFVAYRSPPFAAQRWRFRAGTFLPPFSLENHAIGWTSPYTLNSSAINAWIGEEIRINGGEFKWLFTPGSLRVDVFGAVFFANDGAVKLLAARGFSVSDRELALFDRTPLPKLQASLKNPRGPFVPQANVFEPLHEIDGRPGYYIGMNLVDEKHGRIMLAYYDNNGDPKAINRTEGHYAWDTRFALAGYRGNVWRDVTFITQVLYGVTIGGPRLALTGKHLNESTYFAGYGLLARQSGKLSYAVRGDYFEMQDHDRMRFIYDGAENGYAVSLAASYKPRPTSKITAELQYLDHARAVRVYGGQPRRIDEFTFRLNHRWFF
jgi:hypothetical protein